MSAKAFPRSENGKMGSTSYVGVSVPRVEDGRLLTGQGRFIDDIALPGMLHAAFLRSPYAHAVLGRIEADAARALPGVVAIFTWETLAAAGVRPMRIQTAIPGFGAPLFTPLASDRVRVVGEPVAIVVASSREVAEDALQLIDVAYDPLPAVMSAEEALSDQAPVVFEELGTNLVHEDSQEYGNVAAAFAAADRVVRGKFSHQRAASVPIETRGGVADFDPGRGDLIYHAASRAPQLLRLSVSALIGQPIEQMHVLSPGDIGGSFGQKGPCQREDVVLCFAAKALGRPVKWIEDRMENLTIAGQGRGESVEVEFAVKNDGTILAIDASLLVDQGAYPALPFPSAAFANAIGIYIPSSLRVRNYRRSHRVVTTNKAAYLPLRGPWAVETWVRESMLWKVASELRLPPEDVYRRNLVDLDDQPLKMASGPTLEGVTTRSTLERALELAEVEAFREEQALLRGKGRHLGLGFAVSIEAAPGPADFFTALGFPAPSETAIARLEPNGTVTLFTAQVPHGQGHETTLAQVVADELALPLDHVRIVQGDTRMTPFSVIGTGGSRAAQMGNGAALLAARQLKTKIAGIAATLLGTNPTAVELVDGRACPVVDQGDGVSLAAVAQKAYFAPAAGEEPGLEARAVLPEPPGGWVSSTHVCWVEVDVETGSVEILRYLVVVDCGSIVNPAVVAGQIRGGVAHGIGIALLEEVVYDTDGQLVTATFLDYLVPAAADLPDIEIEHVESPPLTEINFRGVGEGGTITAPAAISNAVSDALAPFGASIARLPLSPTRVLELIEESADPGGARP